MKIIRLLFIMILALSFISCGKKLEDSAKKKSNDDTNLLNSSISATKKNELLNALASNDTTIVKQALATIQNINFHFDNGETPLTFAIKYTKPEIVLRLILTKQGLNTLNKDGQLPINLIIQSTTVARDKKLDLCHQMLKGNADFNKTDATNIAPLLSSIIFNEESIGIYLVKNGANVDAQTAYSISMASFARRYGLNRLESLIRDVSAHTEVSKENLLNAINDNKTNFLQYLIGNYPEYIEIFNNDNLLLNVLEISDSAHRLGLVTYFLSVNNIDPNGANQSEISPLIYAASQRADTHKLSVSKLIKAGSDIFIRDHFNKTALIYAVENLNIDIVTRLKSAMIQSFRQNGQINSEELAEVLREACGYLPRKRAASNMYPYNGRSLRYQVGRALTCF